MPGVQGSQVLSSVELNILLTPHIYCFEPMRETIRLNKSAAMIQTSRITNRNTTDKLLVADKMSYRNAFQGTASTS